MFAAHMVIQLLGFLTCVEKYQSTSVIHETVIFIFAVYVDNDAGLRKLYLTNDITKLITNLFSKKAVALLFHVVINDPGNFLLPDFQAINVDIILDVFKGAAEPIHSSSELFQPYAKLRLLSEKKNRILNKFFCIFI